VPSVHFAVIVSDPTTYSGPYGAETPRMANLLVSVGGLAGGTGGKTAPATLNSYPLVRQSMPIPSWARLRTGMGDMSAARVACTWRFSSAESALWVVCQSAYVLFVTVRHSRPGRRGSWTGG
jgi:hypothetical protein